MAARPEASAPAWSDRGAGQAFSPPDDAGDQQERQSGAPSAGWRRKVTIFGSRQRQTAPGIVALFNASDDTIDMVQTILGQGDSAQTLVWCHVADLKNGSSTRRCAMPTRCAGVARS